jgi:3-oxoadipate enol-lactonase
MPGETRPAVSLPHVESGPPSRVDDDVTHEEAGTMELTAGGGRVEVDTSGVGPPLVLLHSLLTDSRAYDEVVPVFAATRTVHRVSLPGFGASSPLEASNGALTIADLADRVAAAMDALGCGPDTAVLGNGLGAFVAAALAVGHGERFGPLISANGGAAFAPERKTAFGTMASLVLESGMEAVVDVAVRRIFPEAYLAAHPHVIDERRAVLVEVDPGAFAAACTALAALDLRPQVAGIRNPTLVIAGGADQTTPPEMAEELAAGIPGARLEVIDGCGHCPPLEQPAAFAEVVAAFLAEHSG